jgi:hypothetical protein
MFDDRIVYELPLPCVLDDHDVDLLLEKLRAVHGEAGRPDIAPALLAALAARKGRESRRREGPTAEAAA